VTEPHTTATAIASLLLLAAGLVAAQWPVVRAWRIRRRDRRRGGFLI
jgi:hypothetical protein